MEFFILKCVMIVLINVLAVTHSFGNPSTIYIELMGLNFTAIPTGYLETQFLNLAYNSITRLEDFVFRTKRYKDVDRLCLQQNNINYISVVAFDGLKLLRSLDLSNNNITAIDAHTFAENRRLQRLLLMHNFISFSRSGTFLLSNSLTTLVLSHNRIEQIHASTFIGIPNVKNLMLNNNGIKSLSPNSFKTLGNLRYLSLANTGVYHLSESMFRQIPRTLNLEETPLAAQFEPPLKKLYDGTVIELLRLTVD